MMFKIQKTNKLIVLILVFVFAITLRLWNLYAIGRTYDEEAYVERGYKFIELIKQHDFSNQFWWDDPDEPPFARYLYGLAAQYDVVGFDKKGEVLFDYNYKYSRLVSVILSSLAVVLVTLFGWRFISPLVGTYAGIIFAMLPFSLGFSQLATLESFTLFFFTAGVYLFSSLLERYSWKKVIAIGIILGCAVSAKITNILLLPLFLLLYGVWWFFQNKKKKQLFTFLNSRSYSIIYIAGIGFLTFFAIWPMPWFHLDYVNNYVHDLRFSTHLSIPEVFFGALHLVPKYYFIVLFILTTPVVILSFFSFGLWKIKKSKKWILYVLILWFFFPFIQSFYHMRQHGVRYIIEIYAPLSLIAAFGFYAFINRFTKDVVKSILCFAFIIIYLFLILIKMTPYYFDYFNELVGGTKRIYTSKMFQIGWWGEGTKEAFMYLEETAPASSTVGIIERQMQLAPPSQKLTILLYDDSKQYDYVVMHFYNILREGFDDTYLKKNYTRIHCVEVDSACLVAIYKKK